MRTHEKVVLLVMFVVLINWAFGTLLFGGTTVTQTQAQTTQTTLEIRVQNLERQVASLEFFKSRYEAWSWGGYFATLYSSDGKRVVFENDTSFLKYSYVQPDYTCLCRIGDYKNVSLYDQEGNLLDRAEFFSRMKVGDFLVAWYTKTKPANGMPSSPGPVGVSAFYWKESTGLAVGILRIDGTMVEVQ